ncbi:MAG: ABC transporter permease, partial [Gemmatimonadaceae bacterium]
MQFIEQLLSDVRFALRAFRREPVLVVGIVLTFAIAIGANAAMFGLISRLMLSAPEGVSDGERVVHVGRLITAVDGEKYSSTTTSYPSFLTTKAQTRFFRDVAAASSSPITFGSDANTTQVSAVQASGEYFRVLGATAQIGRTFGPTDDEFPGGNAVVVLSDAFWKRQFDSNKNAIGTEITLGGEPFTIVGVAQPGFNGDTSAPVDVFLPLTAAFRNRTDDWWNNTHMNIVTVVGHLREGISIPTAQSALTIVARAENANVAGDDLIDVSLQSLVPGLSARNSDSSRIALWLTGVSIVVLLIATANVGTLLLLRALRRRREMAVRLALGVSRARFSRQLLTESLLLALVGGVAGMLLSVWLSEVIRAVLLPNVAASAHVLNMRALFVTGGVSLAAAMLAGLAPLTLLLRPDIASELKAAGGRHAARRNLFQASLIGVQVMLCTVLLVGAGLFVRSLQRVQSQDLGFSTSHLLYVTFDFRDQPTGLQRDAAYRNAQARLKKLSGIADAAIAQSAPFGPHNIPPISIPGMAGPPMAGQQLPMMYAATPEYLHVMGVTLVSGRLFDARDVANSPKVALINQAFANSVWPNQDPIGKCFRAGLVPGQDSPMASPTLPCREIVGVVRDSRARSLRTERYEAKLMQYYVPHDQAPMGPFAGEATISGIIVQTLSSPSAMIAPVQRLIQGSPSTPLYATVRLYQDLLDPQLRPWRLGASLFSVFGVLALCIAIVGVYAVIAFAVTERTRELGIRLALGGTDSVIRRLVVLSALRMVGGGIVAGLSVALLA